MEVGRSGDAAITLNRLNYINPLDGDLHRRLGDLWFAQGNIEGAIREYQAVLAWKPVDPAASLRLDPALLAQFPEGYRHLAYLQSRIGFAVKRDMPTLRGPEVERLYRAGSAWLAGQPLAW